MGRVRSIDIGSETIKAVQMDGSKGTFVLRRSLLAPIGDAARLPESPEKRKLIAKRVKEALKEGRVKSGKASASVAGKSSTIRYMKVPPVPLWRLNMMVEFEAREQLAKGAACTFDHRILELPYSPSQMIVLVGVVQEQAAFELMETIRSAGIEEVALDLSSTAVFNAYRHLHGVQMGKTTLFVDVGAEESHLVIERNGCLYFARTLMTGGRRFTDAVAQATGLDQPQAEKLKLEEGRISTATPDKSANENPTAAEKMNLALMREASSFAASLEASLMYAKTQTGIKDLAADRLVLSGGGAELNGLMEFLERRLKVTTAERFDPLRNLVARDKDIPPEDLRRMAVVLGTAVGQLHASAFSLDLLPASAKQKREFLRHDIFLYYAIAVLLGALGMHIYTKVAWYLGLKKGLAEREAVLQLDAQQLDEYKMVKEESEWLQLDLNALLERVYSGRDILRVNSVFRKITPDNIRIISMTVDPPKILDEKSFPAGGSFQETRRLFVRGMASSSESDRAAVETVTKFSEDLKKTAKDLFASTETVYISFEIMQDAGAFHKEFILLLELGEVQG
ncbi:MAG: pilus assembly protein PilM [Planctomycetes bacterium]|nr:pilus assembly protein PilM [Planctomycetota bacterium]